MIEFFQGDSFDFSIFILKDKICFDLTNVTAAVLKIPLQAGGFLELTISDGLIIPSPITGEIQASISSVNSALLKTGTNSMELTLDESGKFTTIQFDNSIKVKAKFS